MVMTGKQRKKNFDKRMAGHGLKPVTMYLTPERKIEFEAIALKDRRAIIEGMKNV